MTDKIAQQQRDELLHKREAATQEVVEAAVQHREMRLPSGWTLERSGERIVVRGPDGSGYAADRAGDSGIAESVLYMLAEAMLSNPIGSPAPFSGKGKTPIADAHAEAERMLTEYRHALEDGVGTDSDSYELVCMRRLIGQKNVGLAYSVQLQRAYLLFADADRPRPDYEPLWLLDAAKELTLLMRTFVVPDQISTATTLWAGIKSGPIIAYRFKLAYSPTSVKF